MPTMRAFSLTVRRKKGRYNWADATSPVTMKVMQRRARYRVLKQQHQQVHITSAALQNLPSLARRLRNMQRRL